MNLNLLLARLNEHRVSVFTDNTDEDGRRTVIFGCAAPSFPFGRKVLYYTLELSPRQTDVELEEREAIRRRLCHATTDIFGDDAAGLTKLDEEDISDLLAALPDDLPGDD